MMSELTREEKLIKLINKTFKGLKFDYFEYNEIYNQYEVHFEDGKYFHLNIDLNVGFREIWINPKYREVKENE